MIDILVEIIGWIGSILIVGSYYLNIQGKIESNDTKYIWANLIGGIFFIVNTLAHHAYPSAFVNIVWVVIAVMAILKNKSRSS